MADWTIIKILSWTESYFKKLSGEPGSGSQSGTAARSVSREPKTLKPKILKIDSPRLTAEILLAHTLGIERLDLYLQHDRPLEAKELADYKACIKRRAAGEPVAYITGIRGFYEDEFAVGKGVLIPRPDTETLVEEALSGLAGKDGKQGGAERKTVLELGVGSGAIVVSLAKAAPEHDYFACDISMAALKTASKNSARITPGKVRFFGGSWFEAVKLSSFFDLIVSNPPYISSDEIRDLQPEIREFEPMTALDGGPDGLDAYRLIISQAVDYLVPGGSLLLEIGYDQKAGVQALAEAVSGYESASFIRDLAGHDRVAKIIKKH